MPRVIQALASVVFIALLVALGLDYRSGGSHVPLAVADRMYCWRPTARGPDPG